jgi:molybdopterin-containing oxidoreductase family molybdopterin binding subunit
VLKNKFGEKRGLEWFRKHGAITWDKKPEEVYWRWRLDVRVPLYWEFLMDLRDKAKQIIEDLGASVEIDWSFYEPLPDFKPCPAHEITGEYDLYGFYYREIRHTNSFTMQIPWLDEVSVNDPYTYNIMMHPDTAKKKGIMDGDLVWIESPKGNRVKGRVKLTEGVHPQALAFAACAGHWCDCQPVAKGKGVFFNKLLDVDWDHVNPVNLNLDLCVKLKIYKAE